MLINYSYQIIIIIIESHFAKFSNAQKFPTIIVFMQVNNITNGLSQYIHRKFTYCNIAIPAVY